MLDYNDPIDTPLIFNTRDAGRPSSQVTALPEVSEAADFVVSWEGEDDAGGSGIAGYDVFVSADDQPFGIWIERTEATSATFRGLAGHRYAFYSIARDNVGHTEDPPAEPDAITLAVEPPTLPTITAHPESLTVTEGEVARFTVAADGTAPLAYQWRFDGVPVEGAEGPILELPEVTAEQAGTYDVLVVNVAGSVTSLPAELTVLVLPRILAQPAPREVRQGDPAVFDIEVIGTTPFAYQWRFNGQPLAEESARTRPLVLTAVTPAQAGGYDVVVTNQVGSVTSLVAQLTVLLPPTITTPPVDQQVEAGGTATFTVVAAGSQPLGYLWAFDGVPLTNAAAAMPSLVLTKVTEAQAGNYTVTVTNKVGSVLSNPAKLVVRKAEPPTLTATRLEDGRIVIEWKGNRILQTVEALGGEWQDLVEAASPHTVAPSEVHRFYRLRKR